MAMFTREGGQPYRDGLMGRILRTRIYITANSPTIQSSTTVYQGLFIAWQSYGMAGFTGHSPNMASAHGAGEFWVREQGAKPIELILFDLGETGFDPLKQRATAAWKLSHGVAVLRSAWLRNLYHATVASP